MADTTGATFDAIIIPGGGLEPGSSLPQPWVRARLDEALKRNTKTKYFVVLSRGTTHRPPPIDPRAFPIDEAAVGAKYLLDHGVEDSSRILMDSWSLDTIGNAFFARQMICAPMALRKLLVITSLFHMPRTRAIFDWVFALDKGDSILDYCVTKDVGMTDVQRSARMEKEQKSLTFLQESTVPQVNTLTKLSKFLFQQHGAYNAQTARNIRTRNEREPANSEEEKTEPTDSAIIGTY